MEYGRSMTMGKRRLGRWGLVAGLGLLITATTLTAQEPPAGWRLVFSDDFDRPTLGPNWRWDYSCGRTFVSEKGLRATHGSVARCVVPLPQEEAWVGFDLLLPELPPSNNETVRSVALELRGGEWGAGGNNERLGVVFLGAAHTGEVAVDDQGRLLVTPDQVHHVVMQITGGQGTVTVDGKDLLKDTVPAARSEVNRCFVMQTNGMNYAPGKYVTVSNFRIYAGPRETGTLPLRPNSAAENRRATQNAADFIDPANAGLGLQKAIDALPPGGGVVVLPAGEFVLRRHLRLPSGVTLCGQGAGKTVLRAESGEQGPIVKLEPGDGQVLITMKAQDAGKFRVGDGVCFDGSWGHPGHLESASVDCVVTAVAGEQVTVRGSAPPGAKVLSHWFPLIFAHCAEFVEIRDLTLVGGTGGYGGFTSSALTLGQVAGARLTRVEVRQWSGDGLSVQTAADALVTDNTVSGAANGYHPGTTTQRFLFADNLGLGNQAAGLYFCYHNRNGVYFRNTLDRFDGYGWPFDVYNILAGNDCPSAKGFTVEQGEGGGGIIFNNRFAQIRLGHGHVGAPTHDFLLAENQADSLEFVEGNVVRNMLVGNRHRESGEPLTPAEVRAGNRFAPRGVDPDMGRFPIGAERREPAAPPPLPEPVLRGEEFYKPDRPDAGFQEVLDRLSGTGGTLLLPGGRYALGQPLVVPSGVTLAGRGLGTVLHPAGPEQATSLIVVRQAERATIRDLAILGTYERRAFRPPALALEEVKQAQVLAVDIRGWEGTGMQVSGGAAGIRGCRALGCAGEGFEFSRCHVQVVGNIARECTNGFVLTATAPGARLEANIAGGHRGSGYLVRQADGLLLSANNSGYNDLDGFRVTDTAGAELVANMADNNNQSGGEGCAFRLAGTTQACRLYYNNCQDEQMQPTQTRAICEEPAATRNVIRLNLFRKPAQILAEGQDSIVSENGVD